MSISRCKQIICNRVMFVAHSIALSACIIILAVSCQDSSPSTCPVSSNAVNDDPYIAESYDLHGPSSSSYYYTETQQNNANDDECFVAAVYEHVRVDLPREVQKGININLNAYAEAARRASQNGASILVAPEDGLFYSSRSQMKTWEEIVPEPETLTSQNNNPCVHTDLYKESPILRRLSCIARENNIYFVANFGSKQPCKRGTTVTRNSQDVHTVISDKCPSDNYFQYNTDVIFGPDGTLLRKYKKFNIFIEPFDRAPTAERVVLDTPFGKVGIITCFDMMFKNPAIDLVEKDLVDTILFPTWWFDALPLLSAIQYQDSWSKAMGVNLLAANLHRARLGSSGSGIYSGAGGAQIYLGQNNNQSKLILASIPKRSGKNYPRQEQIETSSRCRSKYKPRLFNIEVDGLKEDTTQYKHADEVIESGKDIIVPLVWFSDTISKCKDGFCCTLTYSISKNDSNISQYIDKLVLVVRNGLRPGKFSWWEQTCFLATLNHPMENGPNVTKNIGLVDNDYLFALNGLFSFENLELSANFATDYVYPIAAHNIFTLVPEKMRNMSCKKQKKDSGDENECKFTYKGRDSQPLLIASMYGRVYDKDQMGKWNTALGEILPEAEKPLPARLRINAHLRIVTGADDDSDYRVDEYIDVPNSRLTIRLQDDITGRYITYYKNSNHMNYRITRYDESKQECQVEESSFNWRLHAFSRLVALLPVEYQIKSETILRSTVIGTGSILYIVMTKLNKQLKFEGRTFDNDRYINLNYYSVLFDLTEENKKNHGFNSDLDVVFRILVGVVGSESAKIGDSMYDTTRANKVPHFIMLDIVDRKAIDEPKDDTFYGVTIDYYLTSKLGTVVTGESSNGQLVNPFILPLGLWCWRKTDAFSLGSDLNQFSALYYEEASDETKMHYLAYDVKTKTLRYDLPGSKTIMDLKQFWAYHITKGTTESSGQQKSQQQQQLKKTGFAEAKCSLIEMDIETVNSQYKDLAKILGFSLKESLYWIGQTEIDGLDCSVYERHLDYIPKIFGYRPMETHLEYFLVVYAVGNSMQADEQISAQGNGQWIPKRLSIISFDKERKKRSVEATLVFTQFSWTLQVSPNEDDSGSSSALTPVHLFDVGECAPIRRGRARLEFYLEQVMETNAKSDFMVESRWTALITKAQSQLQQWIMEHIVNSYGISRARVTNLEVSFRQRAVFVRAILIDIPATLSHRKSYGYYDDNEFVAEKPETTIIHQLSLEECHLEAMARQSHSMTYCPNYWGTCIIKELDSQVTSSDKFIRGSINDRSFCSVYTITEVNSHNEYSMESLGYFLDEADSAAKRLLTDNLIRGYLQLPADAADGSASKNLINFKYLARVSSVKVIPLDAVEQDKVLEGLGYVTSPTDDKHNDDASGFASKMSRNHHVEDVLPGFGSNKKSVGLLYCHKACQLSDRCHSWSFCRSDLTNSWCKLAQLELTKPVMEALSQSKPQSGVQGFLIQYPPDDGAVDNVNVYNLERNRQCSLHSKDYYQLYQQHQANFVDLEPAQLKQFAFVSLDECARLCFRHELPEADAAGPSIRQPVCVRFDYCPVISLCHFEGLSEGGSDGAFYSQGLSGHGNGASDPLQLFKSRDLERQFETNQQCHRYERNYFQYFNKLPSQRLIVTDLENGRDIYMMEVEIKFENFDLNQCVRHCILADERCVGFDYCRAAHRPPHSTCVILTIRSPNVLTSAFINKYPERLSKLEKKYYLEKQEQQQISALKYQISFRDQDRCDHYDLIETYADIKLAMVANKYLADDVIMKQDQEISAESDSPFTGDATATATDGPLNDAPSPDHRQSGISSTMSLVIGLVMGTLIYLAGPALVQHVQDWRQERSARATQSAQSLRFSVLNLAQNEQLQQCE